MKLGRSLGVSSSKNRRRFVVSRDVSSGNHYDVDLDLSYIVDDRLAVLSVPTARTAREDLQRFFESRHPARCACALTARNAHTPTQRAAQAACACACGCARVCFCACVHDVHVLFVVATESLGGVDQACCC